MIDRATKKRLKVALVQALAGKLPMVIGGYRLEAASASSGHDDFLNVKLKDFNGNVLTYFEVKVKESLS